MSLSYTKLFNSLPESTVWVEPYHVRIVWITMLATCDKEGVVHASEPGLAKRANVTLEECLDALKRFGSADEFSRTPDHDGRRIEKVDGGWKLINHGKYRRMLSSEARRESKLNWWHANKKTRGYIKGEGRPKGSGKPDPVQEPMPAAHSVEAAAQALEESRKAAESAAPMPDAIRALLQRSGP